MDHKPITIADQIFEQLEREILSGKYERDEIISESKLSAELGVSRTPVREALRRLEQENFLKETGKGLSVIGITKQDMLEYYEIRMFLEGMAARKAAENISPEELREMREAIDMQRYYLDRQEAEEGDYSEKIKDLDSRFHELIYISSHSNAYAQTLQPIHKKMTKYRKASVRKSSRAEESIKEHDAIYQALSAHDPEKAAELMSFHVKQARDNIIQTVM